MVIDKKKREIFMVKVEIINQKQLVLVINKNQRKYDLFAN